MARPDGDMMIVVAASTCAAELLGPHSYYHLPGEFLTFSPCNAKNRKTGQLNRLNFWFTSNLKS